MTSAFLLGALSETITSLVEILVPTAFITAFPLMWCGITLLIAKMSGWQQLSRFYGIETYPARSRDGGGLHTVYMNGCRYKNAMTIQYDEDGLYLQPMILFRLGHALLYVPWDNIAVQPKPEHQGRFAFYFNRGLTFSEVPEVKITVSKRLIEKIEHFRGVEMQEA